MVDGSTASFLDTHLQQAHFAAQLSHDFPLEAGLLSSSLDLALLTSATDASATKLTGALNWLPTNNRIFASTSARILLFAHGRQEWDIGGSVLLPPGQQGEGLSLQPSFGTTTSRLEQLLASTSFIDAQDLAFANRPPTPEFRAQVAYGVLTGHDALLTPYAELPSPPPATPTPPASAMPCPAHWSGSGPERQPQTTLQRQQRQPLLPATPL